MKYLFCYIHIPFCENKCKYCRFASVGFVQKEKIKKYINKLILDINNYDKKINRLKSVYFGGGTPSTLSIDELEIIINNLKNKFGFEQNIEITLETTPNKISKENLIGWKKIGINRISIGVQTLNNNSLVEIGRGNKGDVIDALNNIEKIPLSQPFPQGEKGVEQEYIPSPLGGGLGRGINISLDFIIGLPHVKKGEIKKDIEFVLDKYNFIKHISVYMLEDHYYPGKWNDISIMQEDYLGEYVKIKNFLKEKGFNRYEISNFAKTGYKCKHNKAYWNHSDMVAFGLGAHGFLDGVRFSYSDNFLDYYNDKINIEKKLEKDDIFLEKVMFLLRTSGLKQEIYEKLNSKKIQEFIKSGYLKIDNGILKIEDKGVLVLDYILGEII